MGHPCRVYSQIAAISQYNFWASFAPMRKLRKIKRSHRMYAFSLLNICIIIFVLGKVVKSATATKIAELDCTPVSVQTRII